MKTIEDLIDSLHFSLNYAPLLLDEGDFAIGRKPQNRSAQVVSSTTRLKNRNFNALPNRCGKKLRYSWYARLLRDPGEGAMPHRAGRRELKPAQRLGLAALNEGTTNELTREQYQQLTGVSRSQAAYDLAELVETGLIERVGGGRSTRYRRATPVAELAASLDERAHSGGPGRLLRESNDVADRRRLQGRGAHRPLRGGESLRRDRLLGLAARVLADGTCRAPTACSLDPAVAALGSCRHRPRSGAVRRVRRGNPTAAPRSDPRGRRSTRYAAGRGSDTSRPH